jgi:hypothetical protein
MNAGFSNTDTLRKFLLGNTLATDNQFDAQIVAIGLGMAGLFDNFCNRKFAYGEDIQQIFRGNRSHWYLPQYPILKITKVDLRYFAADDWTDISGQPVSINEASGLLHFGYTLGQDPIQTRVTWTGGFWWEQLEPDDENYPSDPPENIQNAQTVNPNGLPPSAFILPDAIKAAWLLQCQEVWNKRDKLGLAMTDAPDKQVSLGSLKLVPLVEQMLKPFVRYNLQ